MKDKKFRIDSEYVLCHNQFSMSSPIIRVKNVTKRFGAVIALDALSLEIQQGAIHGLLGPNGAGKTTLVRLLATLTRPDSGTLEVAGHDVVHHPKEVRSVIGLAGQHAAVDGFLTGRETLEMVGALYHMPKHDIKNRVNELLERLSLSDSADRLAKTYSGGMKRRLDVAAALVFRPKVIFLDEPTTGLDPRTRAELWEVIRDLARDGSTILLTTQYLEEADALATIITVIDKGRIAVHGTPSELKRSLGQDIVEVHISKALREKAHMVLGSLEPKNLTYDDTIGVFRLPAREKSKTLLLVAETLQKAGIEPEEISLHRPSLDDVFLAVTEQR